MTRHDFVKAVAAKTGKKQKEIGEVLAGIESVVFDAVKAEDEIKFAFGKIGGMTKEAREARNPATGETIQVAEKKGYPYFKISGALKKNAD